MRIAYVNADPGVPVFGAKGASLHVREVVDGFIRSGAVVHLFARRLEGQAPAGWAKVHLHRLPALPRASQPQREQAALRANHDLHRALEQSAVPFDFIYERYSLWSFAAMEYARANGITSVLEVNAPLVEEATTYRSLSDPAGAVAAMRRAFAAAGNVSAVSEAMVRYVTQQVADPEKIRLIPNAVNPARFLANVAPACPGPPGSFTIGFLGSLRAWHGLPILLEAFEQFHRTSRRGRLLVVGDGPERPAFTEMVKAKDLASVTVLTGAVPSEAVPGYLASMDLAVAPYPNLSNFYFSPLKVYEYMASARAVLASCIGQLKTLIEHGVNGWHVPPGDTGALAAAMLYLWQDGALRQRLGKAARKTVLQRYTWDQVVRSVLDMATGQRAGKTACSPSPPLPQLDG